MADTNNEVKDTTTMDTTANQNTEPAVPASDKKEEKPEPTVQELMVEIAKLRREKDKNASEAADWKKKFRETQSAEEKASAEKAEREAQRQAEYEALVRKDKIHDLTETFMDQGYSKELAKKAAASLVDGDNDTLLECQKQFNAQLIAGEKEKWIASRPEINAGTGNAAENDPFLAGFNSVPTRFGH